VRIEKYAYRAIFNRQNIPIKHNKKLQNTSHQVPNPSFDAKISSGSFSATTFRISNKTP